MKRNYKELDKRAVELWNQGLSISIITKRLQLSFKTVTKKLKKANIKIERREAPVVGILGNTIKHTSKKHVPGE